MNSNGYIECGKIINTHGCYGALKIESWCNTPEELAELKKLYIKNGELFTALNVSKASVFKQFVIVTVDEISSMDDAMAMKGTVLYADRDDFSLEEGEYFIADLNGLPVIDANTQKQYGKIVDVINRGASDIYVVDTPNGERMIPVVSEFVSRVDINEGVFVTPIDGMFD